MPDGQLSNPTHPTPPRTEEERIAWLRLIRSRRIGPVTFYRLMAEHGSAAAAFAALPQIARAAGVEGYQPCSEEAALAELRAAAAFGASPIFAGDADYPPQLAQTSDAPPLLWARGQRQLLTRPMLALVGARNASALGLRMARSLARDLGEAGFVLVSGLARGIDAEAHRASLQTGTIAVQAGGIDIGWPEENAGLAAEIAEQGLLLSEQPPGVQPQARHFPTRNRIVAGLSMAVVVVEAAARSGSLITARLALDLGREVMAVPGHPFDARAEGCNMLIRDGAMLLRNAGDICDALGAARPRRGAAVPGPDPRRPESRAESGSLGARGGAARPQPSPALAEVTRLHALILDRLSPSPLPEDQLIRDLALPPARILPELLQLELAGKINRAAGGMVSRG